MQYSQADDAFRDRDGNRRIPVQSVQELVANIEANSQKNKLTAD